MKAVAPSVAAADVATWAAPPDSAAAAVAGTEAVVALRAALPPVAVATVATAAVPWATPPPAGLCLQLLEHWLKQAS